MQIPKLALVPETAAGAETGQFAIPCPVGGWPATTELGLPPAASPSDQPRILYTPMTSRGGKGC